MSDKKPADAHPRTDSRLGPCALAADRTGKTSRCPDDDAFARLLEAGASDPGQHALLEHISTCEDCCRKWLALSEVLESTTALKTSASSSTRRLLAAAGSVCAVAVGVMLYLSIDYRPMLKTEADRSLGTATTVELQSSDQPADAAGSAVDADMRPNEPVLQEREYQAQGPTMELQSTTGAMMAEDQAVRALPEAAAEPSPAPLDSEEGAAGPGKMQEDARKMSIKEKGFRAETNGAPSAHGLAVIQADALAQFVEQFVARCREDRPNGMEPATIQDLIEQGRGLLHSGNLAADERVVVNDMLGVLERLPAVDTSRFEELCDRAAEFGRTRGYEVGTAKTR
jgi:hypothetical protein